ncbi:MAG: hypothetical protein FJW66_03480 [Actinobacteria bacterium]|nr:hypothetical protein [Actinomycetota bacterium]
MSFIKKNWISIKNSNADFSLAGKLKLTPVLIQLLANRGQFAYEEILFFLNIKPDLKKLHDPLLLPNMAAAVSMLNKALAENNKILIHGDYDTDGVISTAILYNFLKRAGADVIYYIPDRFEDGYDINVNFIKKAAKEKRPCLVICVDCGTNATDVKKLLESSSTGIDVIVCDHHEPSMDSESLKNSDSANEKSNKMPDFKPDGKEDPQAIKKINGQGTEYIIINPKLPGSRYPFKYLSGAGVTFKFIVSALRALDVKLKNRFEKDYLNSLLDLVAISVISDVMPLDDENRIIVKAGLKKLEDTRNAGLKRLVGSVFADRDREGFSSYDIGFIISPRFNASGRVKNAYKSLELLIEDKDVPSDIDNIISELEKFNEERQEIQKKILDEILAAGDLEEEIRSNKIFIRSSPGWSEGVLGIVASELVKKFNVPVLLFRQYGGKFKGSARSIENFNLYSCLELFRDYFEKFGGHSQACGLTINEEKFEGFCSEITSLLSSQPDVPDMEKKYYYDMEIDFDEVNKLLIDEIKRLEPFGTGNPKPVFMTSDCGIANKPRLTRNGKHIFFLLKNRKRVFSSVLFNFSSICSGKSVEFSKGQKINILHTPVLNTFSHQDSKVSGGFQEEKSGIQLVIHDFC